MWYAGTDPDTIKTFGSAERPLIRLSQQNPRREVQQRYLSQVLRLESVPDTATILQTYNPKELSYDEVSLMLAIARVLKADYLIDDVEIVWARISHGVTMLAGSSGERLTVTLSRTWPAVLAVLKIVEVSPELTEGLTKDLVRVHLYSKIQSFVPSSQRVGLEALQKSLSRRRELYRLELEDTGALEPIFAEFLAGRVEFEQVLNAATRASAGHTQRVGHDSVGTVDNVLVDVVNTPLAQEVVAISAPVAGPPILRPDADIRERLLTADRDISQLNNYRLFLGLSDRVFQLERDFFTWPHSTQVAWAGRRVVFLFSLAHSAQTMYYDIELRGARTAGDAGGVPIHTTTIIAKNRIFIPVPPPIVACLQVTDSPVEFYVRFDIIGH
jgi:molecular chaperone HtpG